MSKTKTGGLVSPMTSVKVGSTPRIAPNTLITDIKVTQPRKQHNSGTSLAIQK